MERSRFIPTRNYTSVWISTDLKNGLLLKTLQDRNRYVSITLEKVLRDAGIEELNDTELERVLLGLNSKRRGIVVAK